MLQYRHTVGPVLSGLPQSQSRGQSLLLHTQLFSQLAGSCQGTLHPTQCHGAPQAGEHQAFLSSTQDTEPPSEPKHMAALYYLASQAFKTMAIPEHP